MRVRIAIPESHVSEDVLNSGLEAVTALDHHLMVSGAAPTFSDLLARGGVRWQKEPPGDEHFDHALVVAGRGWGDCDDLAPMRAGELRATGEDPHARAVVMRSGPSSWHAIVERGDGSYEDPSRAAGMGNGVHGVEFFGGDNWRAGWPTPDAPLIEVVGSAIPSVHPLMFEPNGRPAIATKHHRGTAWARVDLPWGVEGHALSCICPGRTVRDALHEAVEGACDLGELCGVDSESIARLLAARALADGHDVHDVAGELAAQGVYFDPALWEAMMDVGSVYSTGRGRPRDAKRF
jgi:hypothetical protein